MNPAIEAAGASLIRALNAKRRPTSINLGMGEPTLLANVVHFERATRWVGEHGCPYSTNIGDADLRAAIAAYYDYSGLNHANNVCITTGSQEAVYVAMRTLLDPACDEVLIVDPAFPVYAKIARVEGIPLRRISLDPRAVDAFDADRILAEIRPNTRMVIVGSPSNPTGRVVSKASARRLAGGLLARGGPPVYVLHDEIYRELVYTDDVGEFGKMYPHTVVVNSLSKSNALTGLRIGWVMAPLGTIPHIVKMHGWVTSCASTFAQRVAYEIFAARELKVQQPWYAAQRTAVLGVVRELGLECIEPDGAFYLCVNVGASDTLGFAEALLAERDVVAIPGHIFSPLLRGWLRTSFVGSFSEVREGLSRIASFASERRSLPAGATSASALHPDALRD